MYVSCTKPRSRIILLVVTACFRCLPLSLAMSSLVCLCASHSTCGIHFLLCHILRICHFTHTIHVLLSFWCPNSAGCPCREPCTCVLFRPFCICFFFVSTGFVGSLRNPHFISLYPCFSAQTFQNFALDNMIIMFFTSSAQVPV